MRPSGSRYGLLRCCAWWARPEVTAEAVISDAAAAGTGKHEVLEALVQGPPDCFNAAPSWGCTEAEWPEIERAIWGWLPPIGSTEMVMYYSPETSTARTDDSKARGYSPRDGEIPMTIDFLRHIDGAVEVWDYKTGRQEHLEPAATNGQLAICCLAAARLTGSERAVGILACVRDDGTAYLDRVDYDALDLDAIAYEARGLMQRVATSQPCPGPWCKDKWCPARAVCPATTQAIVATPLAPLSIVIDSADACARAHIQLALAEEFLAAVKRAHNAWLEAHPGGCELADGSRLVMGIEERDTIECNETARRLLLDAGLDAALELSTSKAAIERAVKATAAKGEATGKIRAVLEALDAEHCIKTTQYAKPKVKKGKKA